MGGTVVQMFFWGPSGKHYTRTEIKLNVKNPIDYPVHNIKKMQIWLPLKNFFHEYTKLL